MTKPRKKAVKLKGRKQPVLFLPEVEGERSGSGGKRVQANKSALRMPRNGHEEQPMAEVGWADGTKRRIGDAGFINVCCRDVWGGYKGAEGKKKRRGKRFG